MNETGKKMHRLVEWGLKQRECVLTKAGRTRVLGFGNDIWFLLFNRRYNSNENTVFNFYFKS